VRLPTGCELLRGVLIAIVYCHFCTMGMAQQSQRDPMSDAPSLSQQPQTSTEATSPFQSGVAMVLTLQNKSRVFPDLATNAGPLDSWQKFKLAANNSLSLSTFGAAVIGSSFGQATNRPAGYGQEIGAYSKRFGADMARAASSNLFGTYMIASVAREDPRFYIKRDLDFGESAKYAAARLVITRSDAGKQVINYAGLVGPLAGEALANIYYPRGSRGVESTLIRYASDQGWRFCGNLLRQYWPTINKRFRLVPEISSSP
jgi:hypothetical protein